MKEKRPSTFQDESKANARLIAAAPELLQILKAILYYDGNDGVPGIQALFKTARSIVNRAEGEE